MFNWFQPSIHSLRGFLTAGELGKTWITAGVVALIAFLGFIQANPNQFFDPKYAALVVFVATQAIAQLRRLNQGAEVLRTQDPSNPAPTAVEIVALKEVPVSERTACSDLI